MKLLCCSLLVMLAWACAATRNEVNTPQATKTNDQYPPVIEAGAIRQRAAEEAWRKMLAEFRMPETRPDLEPVLFTPRALPASLAGQINLNPQAGKFGADEAKTALRKFIEHNHAVLTGDERAGVLSLKDLSLVSFSDEGNMYRALYRQMNYPFPLAGNYGELSFALGKTGALLQMSSRLISPLLLSTELPARAKVEAQKVADALVGREFTYTSIAGRPLTYKVSQREEVKVRELVIYPKMEKDQLAIYLAWQVEVGRGTTWMVYVDAMTGKEIEVRQNFAS
ncbi:MAG TPA: PepSY domain-containing protein [Blastocatellia bacterium]|nr:PepSY domain-containing protein [Blastocatellia bacterium]